MSGNDQAECKLMHTDFPRYFIHPDYSENQKIGNEIKWSIGADFEGTPLSSEWDKVIVTITFTLSRKTDDQVICELVTKGSYQVTAGISFELKYLTLSEIIHQTIGNAQGGWYVKNKNQEIRSKLPQAFYHHLEDELGLKKRLYEAWE